MVDILLGKTIIEIVVNIFRVFLYVKLYRLTHIYFEIILQIV
jgi:hypothetical protein